MTPQAKHRALLALDASGVPRVLATDSAAIAGDVDAVSSDADDIGMCRPRELGPGLWLWEGAITVQNLSAPDQPEDWCPEYKGTLRAVHNPAEVAELFAMSPPEPPEDDRDSPEA